MTIEEEFFEWIYQFVGGRGYRKLLHILYDQEFFTTDPLDDNRLVDGIQLRYRFGYEANIPKSVMNKKFDTNTCSILEMMLALAIRMEDDIMGDPDYGDRTIMWFWMMIKSLGLYDMKDDNIDYDYIHHTIARFLNKDYEYDGSGSLFTVKNINKDMRDLDIWYQMCLFSDSILL